VLKVNLEKCTKCGTCSEICPFGIIINRGSGPELVLPQACIVCGHCVAICPQAALDLEKAPIINQTALEKFPVIDPPTAKDFLRSRRSIRAFKKEKVNRETLQELLDVARYAPTGANSQGISYIVHENPEQLRKITAVTVDWLEEQARQGTGFAMYKGVVSIYRKTGTDVVLHDAPHLIIATAPKAFGRSRGRDSGHFALSYIELYATSLGLGTCWSGFVEGGAQDKYQPLLDLLNIPEDRSVAGVLMLGYPKYTFKRLVDRNPLEVSWH